MTNVKERVGSLKQHVGELFEEALRLTVPEETNVITPSVAPCQNAKFGDYQCNNAMGLWSKVKGGSSQFNGPEQMAQAIMNNLPASETVESCSIAGSYVNVVLCQHWMAKSIREMLINGIETWAPELHVKRAVVDFSSPNIAKEMHVGHLRSTIIGDSLARMLEYANVDVLRRNHVGDWGTQFGMLIEYLFEMSPNGEVNAHLPIQDLEVFYKSSKQRFDSDPTFKKRAQQAVVSLQSGVEKYRTAWAHICDISREGYEEVYKRLGVHLEEKGESFYNPYIPGVLDLLDQKGLIEDNQGARVIFIEGKNIPLIVVKSDGGFNYASTDLAALWYRLYEEKAEWIIYVTDVGQRDHFEMVFTAAKRAGWLPVEDIKYPKTSHVGFGLVLGKDGKRFRTRSTATVKLVDLLDKAKAKYKATLQEKARKQGNGSEWTEEELDKTAEAFGYGAVKYADLKNNRTTTYTFSVKRMLDDEGNSAVNLLYVHAQICSIIRESGKDMEELKRTGKTIKLYHSDERALGLRLLQFVEVVEEAITNLLPNVLCDYLYNISEDFNRFYTHCEVVARSTQETSRLLLCEATAVVMRQCFHLLGITPVYKI